MMRFGKSQQHINIKDAKGQIIYQIKWINNNTGKIKSRTWHQGKQQNSEDYQYNTLEQLITIHQAIHYMMAALLSVLLGSNITIALSQFPPQSTMEIII